MSTFRELAVGLSLFAVGAYPASARGQSCCSGSAAVTPGRLLLHERALVGTQLRGGKLIGSYRANGAFVAPPGESDEVDVEQDLFAALQAGRRGQVALLLPFVETRRATRGRSEWGGGLGDVNASARYDFTRAGESFYLPGVALLLGVTAPTGVPVDRAEKPLATDATGVGAWQGTVGLALEQTFGLWFLGVTALAAERLPRRVAGIDARLGTRFTVLASGALSIRDDAAIALSVSYQNEGNATLNGATEPGTYQHLWTVVGSCSWAASDNWRLHGGASITPPGSSFGANLPSTAALFAGVIRGWP
jgi:hypothetical protein